MLKKLTYLRNKYLPYWVPQNRTRRARLKSTFTFINKQQGHKELLILLCGHKPLLADAYFKRILAYTPANVDVCIVCPGHTAHPSLFAVSERHNWSILFCHKNVVTIAMNIAITQHPQADFIYKMDEDIFITKEYFQGMRSLRAAMQQNEMYDVAFFAPLLNVNGYSYHRVLDLLQKKEEYAGRFGPIKSACIDIPVWGNGEAAQFMWDIIYPLDNTAELLYTEKAAFTVCPHRFSIGAIAFEKTVWEAMDYFITGEEGWLGLDEIQLAEYAAREAKHIIVSDEVLAGHFAFGPQYAAMSEYLSENPDMLAITKP
jgi:hypothetical protein